ncbi:hypothetical protein [Photorhabdus viridis]|uniref:hypothetical protein n=1 Tax=Photorhabdus viridis TaxID=3163327 RepID=UPI0033072A7E
MAVTIPEPYGIKVIESIKMTIKPYRIVISNHLFDTTKAHVEITGGQAKNCIFNTAINTNIPDDWKINFDLEQLAGEIRKSGQEIAAITIMCNSVGG